MMKIFNWHIFKGTYLNTKGTQGSSSNTSYRRGDKELQLDFTSTGEVNGFGAVSGVKTIVQVIKPTGNTPVFLDNGSAKLSITAGSIAGTGLTENYINLGQGEVNTDAVTLNKWQIIISEFSAGISFATDLEVDVTTALSLAGEVWMFDSLLSYDERQELYYKFQNSGSFWSFHEIKTEFTYPKPTGFAEYGKVAHYVFSPETVSNGTLLDISGNANHGTISGALLTKDGMKFDGVDDYVSITNPSVGANDFTIVSRFYLNTIPSTDDGEIVCFGTSGKIQIRVEQSTGDIEAYMAYSTPVIFVPTAPCNQGRWNTVVLSVDKDGPKSLFLNGSLVEFTTGTSTGDLSDDVYIGKRNSDRYLNHINGDLKIYNYAFTAAQAKAYHNQWVKPVYHNTFKDEGVGETNPNTIVIDSGAVTINERTTAYDSNITIGTKYLQFTSDGAIKIFCPVKEGADIKISRASNQEWITYFDTIERLIDTWDWIDYSDNYIVITGLTGNKFTNITVWGDSKIDETLDLYYGIQWDETVSSPSLTPIGDSTMLSTKPLHEAIRHAVINEDKSVNYYLDSSNFNFQEDGVTPSDLTGTDGDVVAILPYFWAKYEKDGIINRMKVSPYPLPGYKYISSYAYGIYGGYVDGSNKLRSISGVRRTTNKYITEFRTYAANKGSGWCQKSDEAWTAVVFLALIDIMSFNSQAEISAGATNASSTDWNNYNAYNPVVDTGLIDSLGSFTGGIPFSVANFVGGTLPLNSQAACWRGIEHIFGDIWEFVDGLNIHNSAANGARAYSCKNPAHFASDTDSNYELVGNIAEADGYVKKLLGGTILPKEVGGGSTIYMCDYHYSYYDNDPNSGWRVCLWGGALAVGAVAGLLCAHCSPSSSDRYAYLGARLCCKLS